MISVLMENKCFQNDAILAITPLRLVALFWIFFQQIFTLPFVISWFPVFNLKNGLTDYTLEEEKQGHMTEQEKTITKTSLCKASTRKCRNKACTSLWQVRKVFEITFSNKCGIEGNSGLCRTSENLNNLLPPRASKDFKILLHLSWQNAVKHSVGSFSSTQGSDPSIRITVWWRHRKFHTNIKKNLFTVMVTDRWNGLPRRVVGSPPMEICKTNLDAFLCDLF